MDELRSRRAGASHRGAVAPGGVGLLRDELSTTVQPAVTARWAPDLTVAMSELARRVEEELVLDDLLDNLAAGT
ncbi:MAG TPA: hypothetical protein VIY28_14740 [Pseudonocardiaceae bacterium]